MSSETVLVDDATNHEELMRQAAALNIDVPPRGQGRRSKHTERYSVIHMLQALPSASWDYPLSVVHADRPDFVLRMPTYSIGIEHTEIVSENTAHASALRLKGLGPEMHFVRREVPGSPKKTTAELVAEIEADEHGTGWEGDSVEREWAEAVVHYALPKINKLHATGFRRYEQNWLLMYDGWDLPHVDARKAANFLLRHSKLREILTAFNRVVVLDDAQVWDFARGRDASLWRSSGV